MQVRVLVKANWAVRLTRWMVNKPFTFTLTCITFNLYYYYITMLLLPTLCPLPPLWYQSHSFLAGGSGVVSFVSLSMSTRNFGTLTCMTKRKVLLRMQCFWLFMNFEFYWNLVIYVKFCYYFGIETNFVQ